MRYRTEKQKKSLMNDEKTFWTVTLSDLFVSCFNIIASSLQAHRRLCFFSFLTSSTSSSSSPLCFCCLIFFFVFLFVFFLFVSPTPSHHTLSLLWIGSGKATLQSGCLLPSEAFRLAPSSSYLCLDRARSTSLN